MRCLVAIVGPTAVGKSKLALQLASDFGAEIVSADSRQVYRYMDIGTNKPTLDDQKPIPHHLIDVVNPDDDFNLANYLNMARRVIQDIQQRGNLPLLVGGSGLYVWSIIEGWKIPNVPPDRDLRRKLEIKARKQGSQALYQQLREIDPVITEKIEPHNIRRIIRALEIYQLSGQLPSVIRQKQAPRFSIFVIGLTAERSELYHKIDQRVDKMINGGLVEEVKELMHKGYSLSLPSMSGIGYKQIGDFLSGSVSLPKAVEQIKYETHRLARHQYAWFRPSDARINWLDANNTRKKANDLVESFLS
ncbi:tRNA dimethylallyltransferase [subsurface metagenome]